jgi:pimeloyl-ACP methyl ester carboxylesterase
MGKTASRTLVLTIAFLCCAAGLSAQLPSDPSAALPGKWEGALAVGRNSLRLVFNVAPRGQELVATMDSPDQGAKGIPVDRVAIMNGLVRFEMKVIGGLFEGRLSGDGGMMEGTWKQSGQSFPLVLKKAAGASPAPAAVTPAQARQDGEYSEIEVEIPGKSPGIVLAGTLTLPRGKGPFPGVVFISGSGPQNRDEEILGHRPFRLMAQEFARRGIASLRYDDRGVGKSSGSFMEADSFDLADDAEAVFGFLAKRTELDPGKCGLAGHSEGGLVAAIVASRNAAVSHIVMLAGPGLQGKELLPLQTMAIAVASGVPETQAAQTVSLNVKLYDAAMQDAPVGERAAQIAEILKAERNDGALKGLDDATAESLIANTQAQLLTPWFRTFLRLDPADYLSRVAVPVLAVNGSKDLQVPAAENLKAIGEALEKAGNRNFRLVEMAGLNHLFQTAGTGLPAEYGSIAETMAPAVLALVGDWILSPGR